MLGADIINEARKGGAFDECMFLEEVVLTELHVLFSNYNLEH